MKIIAVILVLTATLCASSCAVTTGANSHTGNTNISLLRPSGAVHPSVKGYWRSIGNGYILDAAGDSVLLYSFTKHFCYKEKNDYLEGLLNGNARFLLKKDTLSIYSADFGDKSTMLQIKRDFVRIDSLPKHATSFEKMIKLGSRRLFQLFIETYEENYAFSKERNMNWGAIKSEFDDKISDSTSESELFSILGQIVTRTKDHHTKVIAENGEALQYRSTPSAEIVAEAFRTQSDIKQLDDYFNLFFDTNYKNISDSLLRGKGNKVVNGQIEWGSVSNTVGYISIYAFEGFAPKGYSRKQQIDSLNEAMERIIYALKDKAAIVIDISFDFGGHDAAALTIASYFTDKPKWSYTSQVYTNGDFYDEAKVYLRPAEKIKYAKPVYILMSDISRSQAEDFAMAMKANSNVKLVGTRTLGILSSMLGKSVGNFYCTLSNQRLIRPDGQSYEVSGVQPDIPMTIFTRENILQAHKEAMRKLVQQIETNNGLL